MACRIRLGRLAREPVPAVVGVPRKGELPAALTSRRPGAKMSAATVNT
ncbi:MAG: hypothetical protein U0Y68_18810 [Blastocatellia bacterium]